MKKLLGILVLSLFLSFKAYAEKLKLGEVVKDPDIIELIEKQIKIDHKKKFDELYFDSYIKCTKSSLFSKDDVIFFGLPLQTLWKEIHAKWDPYKHDFINWHIMKEMHPRYYLFHKLPGMYKEALNNKKFYKIDRENGDMFEINEKINSEKKIRNCEKISYSDLPMLETKAKF